MSSRPKPKPIAKRGGRYRVLLELEPEDNRLLDALVKRYTELTSESSKAFVLRQLIRNASEGKGIPKIRLT